jgi:hypothetical protein
VGDQIQVLVALEINLCQIGYLYYWFGGYVVLRAALQPSDLAKKKNFQIKIIVCQCNLYLCYVLCFWLRCYGFCESNMKAFVQIRHKWRREKKSIVIVNKTKIISAVGGRLIFLDMKYVDRTGLRVSTFCHAFILHISY